MSEAQKDAAIALGQIIYANTIKSLEQQVAAQQARIAELREALLILGQCATDASETDKDVVEIIQRFNATINDALKIKDDLSALEAVKSQARRAALLEAADRCHVEHRRDDLTEDYRFGAGMCEHYIRRMAGEVKP